MDDTHPKARRVQIELLRQLGPQQRLEKAIEFTDTVLRRAKTGIARVRPELSERERSLLFVEVHYGRELANRLRDYLARRCGS